MTDTYVIKNKISSVRKYLNRLEKYKKYSQKEIEDNIDIQGAVERFLQLTVQATIDLAEAVISAKSLRKPSTLSESFHVLNEENIIENKLTEELIKMTGFRNIIEHDYEDIDYEIVYNILHNKLSDVERFIDIIEKV